MLEKIVIRNYLLLKDIEIDFSNGFNIITGETGAGKTILVNALSLLLGERADYSIISSNKEKMAIEGFIKKSRNNEKIIEKFLKDNEIETLDENYLILRRELYTKGYSRNFINDSPVNINDLKSLGDELIDIHSQNEHQSLLKKEIHIEVLDAFILKTAGSEFIKLTNEYEKDFEELSRQNKLLNDFLLKKNELESKRNFLEFQLKEIAGIGPVPGEDDELEIELKTAENAEIIQKSLAAAHANLYEESGSVAEKLKTIEKELQKIKEFNPDIPGILKDIAQSSSVLNESSRLIYELMSKMTFDPDKIESIRERLFKLQFLKKKYGGTVEEVLRLKASLEKDLSLLDSFEDETSKLEQVINELKEKLHKSAQAISKTRKTIAKKLESEVEKVFSEVGLENAEFKVNFDHKTDTGPNNFTVKSKNEYIKLTGSGIDDVEFMVRINKGDEFTSLRKTASGGEVSRIMLALKTVLAGADRINVLVFDEIDTGISGRIAQKVGRVLKKLSSYHQVISVTHLAQIAALADEHFLVEKEEEKSAAGGKTVTKIRKLDNKERVIEIAKLLSGEKVTDSSIRSAKELIGA